MSLSLEGTAASALAPYVGSNREYAISTIASIWTHPIEPRDMVIVGARLFDGAFRVHNYNDVLEPKETRLILLGCLGLSAAQSAKWTYHGTRDVGAHRNGAYDKYREVHKTSARGSMSQMAGWMIRAGVFEPVHGSTRLSRISAEQRALLALYATDVTGEEYAPTKADGSRSGKLRTIRDRVGISNLETTLLLWHLTPPELR